MSVGSPPEVFHESEYVDLTSVFGLIGRFKWLICLSVALGMGTALAASVLIAPKYEAEVLVMPATDQARSGMLGMLGNVGGLAGIAGLQAGDATKKETAKAILESRQFAEKFIVDRDLMPLLFAGQWDPDNRRWLVESPAEEPTLWDGVRVFRESILGVTEDPRSGLIRVQVKWTEPDVAAEWANALVGRLNETVRDREIDIARRTIEYLNRELENTSVVELRAAVYELIEEQIQTIAFASVRDEFAFQVLDPAAVADPDDYVSPNRPLMVAFGGVAGLAGGFALSLLFSFRRSERTEASAI